MGTDRQYLLHLDSCLRLGDVCQRNTVDFKHHPVCYSITGFGREAAFNALAFGGETLSSYISIFLKNPANVLIFFFLCLSQLLAFYAGATVLYLSAFLADAISVPGPYYYQHGHLAASAVSLKKLSTFEV